MSFLRSKYLYNSEKCPVCYENLGPWNLRSLGCQHALCRTCYSKLLPEGQGFASCPVCRAHTTYISHNSSTASINSIGLDPEEVKSSFSIMENSLICNACETSNKMMLAPLKCIECDLNFCSECSVSHRKYPLFRTHHFEKSSKTNQYIHCNIHGKPTKYVCLSCKTDLCPGCFYMKVHADHQDQIKERENIVNETLLKVIDPLRKQILANKSRTNALATNECDINEYDVVKQIKEKAEKAIHSIKLQEEALISQVWDFLRENNRLYEQSRDWELKLEGALAKCGNDIHIKFFPDILQLQQKSQNLLKDAQIILPPEISQIDFTSYKFECNIGELSVRKVSVDSVKISENMRQIPIIPRNKDYFQRSATTMKYRKTSRNLDKKKSSSDHNLKSTTV